MLSNQAPYLDSWRNGFRSKYTSYTQHAPKIKRVRHNIHNMLIGFVNKPF
jgi:hypothetical protein